MSKETLSFPKPAVLRGSLNLVVSETFFPWTGDEKWLDRITKGLAHDLKDVNPCDMDKIEEMIRTYGRDWLMNFESIWSLKRRTAQIRKVFAENLKELLKIESIRPGISRALHSGFEISNFARYPKEILIAQYDERNIKDNTPYVAIIFPFGDKDGSFYTYKGIFKNFFRGIKGKGRVRIWEFGDKKGLLRAANSSRKRYGEISLGILNHHGNKDDIVLSYGRPKTNELARKDLDKKGVSALRLAFIKHPTLILNSCETGESDGIAQKISRVLEAKVIAPSKAVRIKSINGIVLPNSAINAQVEYEDSSAIRIYVNGVLQKFPYNFSSG